MKGCREKGLYFLNGATIVGSSTQILESQVCATHLWHKHLAHVSEGGIQTLHKQGLLGKGNLKELEFCETCVLGKARRLRFSKSVNKTTEALNYIDSNFWGPANKG